LLLIGQARADTAMHVSGLNKQALLKGFFFDQRQEALADLNKAEELAKAADEGEGLIESSINQCFLRTAHAEFDEVITLYALTNTYFEGTARSNAKAALGNSKEKRSDCPLVTLALVLDGSGFPRRSEVFAGNASEPHTLAEMVGALQDKEASRAPTVVLESMIWGRDMNRILKSCTEVILRSASRATESWERFSTTKTGLFANP